MPEDLAGLTALTAPAPDASDESPIDAPATEEVSDIEKVRVQLTREYDERIKGFQRQVSERETELRRLREQEEHNRLAAMPDDERMAYERSRTDEEVQRLRTENEVLRMSQKYTTVMDKYRALMDAKSVEEQFQLLDTWLKATTPSAETDEDEPAEPARSKPAPVDRNNPVKPRTVDVGGYQMDDNIAQRILKSVAVWPRG
jgi:hypothetical protein